MESVSHLSQIPSQIYLEHFENGLNLVGKSITYINTLINTDDIYNIPEFEMYDWVGNVAYFPKGNYSFAEFIDALRLATSEWPVYDEGGNLTSEKGPFRIAQDGNLSCLTSVPYERNETFYYYFPSPFNRAYTFDDVIPLTEEYQQQYITWNRIDLLRVYSNIIDNDNDLITIPLYTEKGLDNTFAISDLCIPCIDGIYNDIQWSVYDQLNNPINMHNSKLYIYFTAS